MQLEIDLARSGVPVLTGVDDFRRLAVVVGNGPDPDRLAAALSSWGDPDGTHVWLDIDRLEQAIGGHPQRPIDWSAGFAAMIDFAQSQGWVDGDRRRVRAHCEEAAQGAEGSGSGEVADSPLSSSR